MAAQTIQDLKALPKLNGINNWNDVLINSIKQEDTGLLESKPIMGNSPRTPRTDITTTSRRRRQHTKHFDSETNPLLNSSNTNTSEKSENDSAYGSNASTDQVFYNLIEYYGNDSSAYNKSEFHIQNMSNSNSEMARVSHHSVLGSSPGTKFVKVEDIMRAEQENGTAKKIPKKIVFLVPAELEAFVEILKVQSIAAVKITEVQNVPSLEDAVFSGINQLPTSKTTLPSSTPDSEVSDFRRPIKHQMKNNKKKRNAPYHARRIVQNCDKENYRHQLYTVKDSSNARCRALTDNAKLEIPKSYVQQDFQQTRGSAGPIRSKASYYRDRAYKQTPPLRSYSNSSIDNNNNTRTNDYYSQNPSAGMDLFSRDRNYRNKPYYNSKLRKFKPCWNCQSDYHLSKQCPFA